MTHVAVIPDREAALHKHIGERRADAHRQVASLEGTLRHIDELRDALKEIGVSYELDLGEVGNAAADARRQLEAGAVRPSFALPKES